MVGRLERLFAETFGVRAALAHCNGTATLHTALAAVGVGPGDEVIVPPLTMASPAYAALHQNAVPVFADVDPETFNLDPADVENRITERTRAIMPVALYGLAPDLDTFMALGQRYTLRIIEDDAECFLGRYKGRLVGSIGDMASFSFQSSKHMTSGEGGMLVTNDLELAARARQFSILGYGSLSPDAGRSHVPKEFRQEPDFARHVGYGWNYRLPELCAAVALGQLERLEELVELRQRIGELYLEAIADSPLLVSQKVPDDYVHSYWAFAVRYEGQPFGISWRTFRDKLVELGGDGPYGAWQLTYLEPFFTSFTTNGVAGRARFAPGLCPVAERLQPRIMAFKTNYGDLSAARRQTEALASAIAYFS